MIKPNAELPIARQSPLLNVSRSSVYDRPKPDSADELDLLWRLDQLFTEHPIYGSRRLQVLLKRAGIQVGRRRIRRLMRKLGLWAGTPKPDTSRAHPKHKVYPYLLRGMTIDQPNQVWGASEPRRMRPGNPGCPAKDRSPACTRLKMSDQQSRRSLMEMR